MSVHGEFSPVQTSRLFRRERIKAQKPPPARTHRVHTKTERAGFEGPGYVPFLTNPLLGHRFSKQTQFDLERAVRDELRAFAFRRWN
jgi:hypothetical protein